MRTMTRTWGAIWTHVWCLGVDWLRIIRIIAVLLLLLHSEGSDNKVKSIKPS